MKTRNITRTIDTLTRIDHDKETEQTVSDMELVIRLLADMALSLARAADALEVLEAKK